MNHLKIIGSLNLVVAALNLVGGTLYFTRGPEGAWLTMGALTILVIGTLALIAGIGLLAGRSRARVPALIVAAAVLIVVPFGTAFGTYVIVLLRDPVVRGTLA